MHDTAPLTASSVPASSGWWTSRLRALDFAWRAEGLRWMRRGRNLVDRWDGTRFAITRLTSQDPVRAECVTPLWTQHAPHEWPLTAGKVHNLRTAASRLDGLVVQPGEVFSFWHAIGAPTRRRGFVPGRELREGCLIASIGGGLCQLSNALYAVALDAGARIVERHPHSRVVPGSQAEARRDATVFWNYLDLRFALPQRFVVEARLDGERLIVRLRGTSPPARSARPVPIEPDRRPPAHDCLACAQTDCLRRVALRPVGERVAVMPVAGWPEFDTWLAARGIRLRAMSPTGLTERWHRLAARACRHRPARRQHHLIAADDARASAWLARVPTEADELIVPVDALAELQRRGALGGRRVTVMMTRSPLRMLHQQLDGQAGEPTAAGLREYRAPDWRVDAEWKALRGAVRVLTPHHAVARWLRARGLHQVGVLEWHRPTGAPSTRGGTLLFPASSLARKGALELRDACQALGLPLAVLGRATESPGFWHGVEQVPLDAHDPWHGIGAVVMPARVEHAPRWLLQALARGLPVIATPACGLDPRTPGLRLVPAGDPVALTLALCEIACSDHR
jgi:hypothetical protein